ncbi:Hypothetical_protein [Hexamita inflata]|uniref:Hypothetical_protein n=1 Tax=Hexamita inflata TaxID=28002 RepID=A0ABP1GJW6_9EUKA
MLSKLSQVEDEMSQFCKICHLIDLTHVSTDQSLSYLERANYDLQSALEDFQKSQNQLKQKFAEKDQLCNSEITQNQVNEVKNKIEPENVQMYPQNTETNFAPIISPFQNSSKTDNYSNNQLTENMQMIPLNAINGNQLPFDMNYAQQPIVYNQYLNNNQNNYQFQQEQNYQYNQLAPYQILEYNQQQTEQSQNIIIISSIDLKMLNYQIYWYLQQQLQFQQVNLQINAQGDILLIFNKECLSQVLTIINAIHIDNQMIKYSIY